MAVKLRLKRMGKKKQPIYKVVAADARSPRDGKFIEAIGLYNPKTEPATIEIKESRAMYWLNVGAQPTVTVKNLLSGQGIILRRELLKKGLKEEEVAAKLEEWKKLTEANLAAKLKKKADKKKSKKALAKEKSQGATEA
ncbi:MAG: 30S ribosomal protein S16 [Ignavibacteriales bacterium]|nr:MAG: 30S ribosomal protein S16 [Stygiobacter sp.]KAF0212591.1 MAG: 30S ribosomal protein [Ignavibacteria bacterium]MBI3124188.1 30S ribosomal protein S16 [Ignavibacteriales bacterium]RJQ61862.1 MAG: 30S ribosomal protein S16 [Stygiobacter sp.]